MNLQILIVIIVLIGCVAYVAHRIYRTVREGGDPCRDCALKQECAGRIKQECKEKAK